MSLPSNHCPDCGRPQATDEHEGTEPGVCFVSLNPDEEWAQLCCWEAAVPRLRAVRDARELRAQFAGQALQGILSDASAGGIEHGHPLTVAQVARFAVQYADQLLAEFGHEVSHD